MGKKGMRGRDKWWNLTLAHKQRKQKSGRFHSRSIKGKGGVHEDGVQGPLLLMNGGQLKRRKVS